jgi:hypothetical protein
MQPKASIRPPVLHLCPVCHQPQTKIQRRLSGTANGSTIYICARVDQCSVGMNLTKVDTWVAV